MKKCTIIEIGEEWCLWRFEPKIGVCEAECINAPVYVILNTAATSVRLDCADFYSSQAHVSSSNSIGKSKWTSYLPEEDSRALVEKLRLLGVKPNKIQAIDTLEYRMSYYLLNNNSDKKSLLLFLPQKPGIRLVAMHDGAVWGCYFFSNDPEFRLNELERIWLHQPQAIECAVVLSENLQYAWLHEFLEKKHVKLLSGDFRRAMLDDYFGARI